MVTISDLEKWKPDKLTSIADDLTRRRTTFTDLQDEVDDGKPPTSWVGADSVAAENTHNQLVDKLVDQVAELGGVIAALDAAASDISSAKTLLDGALSRAKNHGFDVDRTTGTVSSPKTYDDDTARSDDEALMKEIAGDIGDALQKAADADGTLAGVLTTAKKTTADASGTLADQSLYDDLRHMSTQQQAKYLFDHPERASTLLPDLPEATKKALGDLLADDIDNTISDDDYDLSQNEVDQINTLLDAYGRDGTITSSLYQKLGAEGLVGNYANLESYMRNSGLDNLDDLAANLRDGLGTASQQPGFPADQFGRDLVRYSVVPQLSQDEQDEFQDRYPGYGDGASILTYLMQGTGYSDGLVSGAANQLDAWERQAGWDNAEMWYSHNGYSPLDTGATGSYYDDPMAAIMNQLGDHPKAGLQFFTGDPDREKYYFDERTWKADGYEGISHAADGIGTDETNLKDHPEATTKLVSSYFDYVTDSDGFNADDAKPASPYVSDLMKAYMPAVDDALQHQPDDLDPGTKSLALGPFGTIEYAPRMFAPDIDKLLQVSMSTPDGMQHIAEGVGGYQQEQVNALTSELQKHPDDIDTRNQLRDVLQRSANLQGAAEHAVGQVEIDGAKDQDAQRAAFIGLVNEAAGLVPLPGADVVGDLGSKVIDMGVSHALDLGTGAAEHHFANATEGAVADSNTRAAEGLNRVEVNALMSLVNSGVIELSPEDAHILTPNGEPVDLSTVSSQRMGDYASIAMNNYLNKYLSTEDFSTAYKDAFLKYYDG